METFAMIVAATLAGGVLSVFLAATVALTVLARWADRLVSFAVGVLLATALLDLLPEAAEALGPHRAGAWVLGGVLAFFVLEKLALWRHAHADVGSPQAGRSVVNATMITIGDGVHNLIDGVLIAAAFLQDTALGVATAIAVTLHEAPAEIGDFMVLLSAGYSKRKALLLNVLAGAAAVAGGALGYFALRDAEPALPYLVALAAASFLYIAVADLVPHLQRMRPRFGDGAGQLALIGAGVMAMVFLNGHAH